MDGWMGGKGFIRRGGCVFDFSQTGSPVSKVLIALNTTGKNGLDTTLSPTLVFFGCCPLPGHRHGNSPIF